MTARAERRRRRPRERRSREPPAGAAGLTTRLKELPRVARAIVGLIGFITTVVGLVFVLWPSLKPDEPPVDQGATLSNAQVESGMTFGEYLDRIEQSRAPYGAADLARRGAYVEFDFSVRGYKGKLLPLRWQLIDSPSGAQLRHSRDLQVKPKANTDSASWPVWIPLPRPPRRMYVQIQLYNDAGDVPIGRIRTPEFDA